MHGRALVLLALCDCGNSLRLFAQPRCAPHLSLAATPETNSDAELIEQRRLFDERKRRAEAAGTPQLSWSTKPTRAVLDGLFRAGWQPRLEPKPLPIVELDKQLEPEALARLLRHECCAVVVRGFVELDTCHKMAAVLRRGDAAWRCWRLNGNAASDVDKAGLVSSEALQSFEAFRQYLDTRPGGGGLETRLDAALSQALEGSAEGGAEAGGAEAGARPAGLGTHRPAARARQHPFDQLHAALDAAHPDGCRRVKLGKWELPTGTFRRMRHSTGLIHADTSPRLSAEALTILPSSILPSHSLTILQCYYYLTILPSDYPTILPSYHLTILLSYHLTTLLSPPYFLLTYLLSAHHLLTYSLTHSLTYSLPTHLLLTYLLTHSLAYSPTYSPTYSLGSSKAGEFAANLYLSTAPGQGSLSIYPVEQNDRGAHLALSPLEWELQTVHAPSSQARIAAALPLRRTIELSDGDLVLLCTGRFHAVDTFEGGDRLSGQCWLSFKRGSPLRMWV